MAHTIAAAASKTGYRGQHDGPAHAEGGHQAEGEQRAADGAEVVHGPLEAIGAPIDCRRDDVGQQRVSGRHAEATREPCSRSEDTDLPCGARESDRRGEYGGGGVAADRDRAASPRIVRKCSSTKPGGAGKGVGQTLDEAQSGRGRTEGGRQQAGQEGGGYLMAKVGEEARGADATDAWRKPALRDVRLIISSRR